MILKESDIAAYKSLLSQSELDKLDLEEQNKELHRQISSGNKKWRIKCYLWKENIVSIRGREHCTP